jgi:uncharacterized membrane protein YhhN
MIRVITIVYFVVAGGNILAQLMGAVNLERLTKPMLMPILIFLIYQSRIGNVNKRILLLALALILSWIGDIALMYDETLYFLIGIGFFLLAQVTYIIVLSQSTFQPITFDSIRILPFLIYAFGLFRLILPNAGEFQIPILLYGVVITSMASIARLRVGIASQESYQLAFWGSILFMVSDSIIAINRFSTAVPLAGFWIMITYIGAQFLLVKGLLAHAD